MQLDGCEGLEVKYNCTVSDETGDLIDVDAEVDVEEVAGLSMISSRDMEEVMSVTTDLYGRERTNGVFLKEL